MDYAVLDGRQLALKVGVPIQSTALQGHPQAIWAKSASPRRSLAWDVGMANHTKWMCEGQIQGPWARNRLR